MSTMKNSAGCNSDDIVISGFSGRFPSSSSVEEFEQNLYDGVDMVSIDDSRWPLGKKNSSKQ